MCKNTSACIHCQTCMQACVFLKKYNIDLHAFAKRPDLAYHCFLCGECARQCPMGIDGREIALSMRREGVAAHKGKVPENGYGALLAEKKHYKFQNYHDSQKKSVLFPGCNFPAFFPDTTKKLISLLRQCAGMGVVFDCCGKPVSELGMEHAERETVRRIAARLKAGGVAELVVLCPNCYYYLKPRLSVPVISIYEKLMTLGIGDPVSAASFPLFVPCPDRDTRFLYEQIKPFFETPPEPITSVQCCGWGGGAASKEPLLARQLTENLRSLPRVYTYCASCSGSLTRAGCRDVRHVLTEILGTCEPFPQGARSLWNRAQFRFFR